MTFQVHILGFRVLDRHRYACVLRMLSMKETCRNLVRRVDQREDLQIQKKPTGKENRMLNWVRAGYGLETGMIVGMISDQFGLVSAMFTF